MPIDVRLGIVPCRERLADTRCTVTDTDVAIALTGIAERSEASVLLADQELEWGGARLLLWHRKGVDRRQLRVGSFDGVTHEWLGGALNIDDALRVAEDLYQVLMKLGKLTG
jgi:hypothetical protein